MRSRTVLSLASLALVVALRGAAGAEEIAVGEKAPDFKVKATDGKEYTLESFKDAKAIIVTFTCNNCPVAVAYEDRFIAFAKKYKEKGVVFLAINCVSNSPSHARYQVLINDYSNGGGQFDFTSLLTNSYRRILDSVQAPPPVLTAPQLSAGAFEFTVPGQRGRTNRVEATTNFVDWLTVTNVFGTNAPIRIRQTPAEPERFYRVRRL